jgi:hypothetical protein
LFYYFFIWILCGSSAGFAYDKKITYRPEKYIVAFSKSDWKFSQCAGLSLFRRANDTGILLGMPVSGSLSVPV